MQDKILRQILLDALNSAPDLNAAGINLTVSDGVVTLSGQVPSLFQRMAAERIAAALPGVRGIAQTIEVRIPESHRVADTEIARRIADQLDWSSAVPKGAVTATVAEGWVTLRGTVDYNFQRAAAAATAHNLAGVTGVTNQIAITAQGEGGDLKDRITRALVQAARLDAEAIDVTVANGCVTLSGRVRSYAERLAAEHTARETPGVRTVDDRIRVVL